MPRLYSSSDVPDFHTYPATPRDAAEAEESSAPSRSAGAGAGALQDLKQKSVEIVNRASDYALDLKEDTMAAGSRWYEMAQDNARHLARRSKEYSRTAARDYPLHIIAGAALFGVLIGVGLRVWREKRV